MTLKRTGQYTLIAEWEQARGVALVNPQNIGKYTQKNKKGNNNYYSSLKIKSLAEDFNTIAKTVMTAPATSFNQLFVISKSDAVTDISICQNNSIKHIVLPEIKDIWIKDFAPLPARNSSGETVYIKPLYRPEYLSRSEADIQHKIGCKFSTLFNRELVPLPLVWDIGNLTHNGRGTAIVTRRLLKDNPGYKVKEIRNIFKSVMSIDNLIMINEEKDDFTGHIDGTLRFISRNKIAIASYPSFMKREKRYIKSVKNTIRKNSSINITFIDIPNSILIDDMTDGMYSVFGNHINFLRLNKHVFMPVYNIPSDAASYRMLSRHIVDAEVIPVRISSLSHFSGALNCMTWNVY